MPEFVMAEAPAARSAWDAVFGGAAAGKPTGAGPGPPRSLPHTAAARAPADSSTSKGVPRPLPLTNAEAGGTHGGGGIVSTPPMAPVVAMPLAQSPEVCAWSGCRRQLSADPAQRKKCGNCKRAFYCGRTCQKRHWGRGGHKLACVEPPCCTICLQGGDDPLPTQRGCACRGAAGLAHVACLAQAAAHKGAGHNVEAWSMCATCGEWYTGATQLALARKLAQLLERRAPEDVHQLYARANLGQALLYEGKLGEAEVLLRDVLAIHRRVQKRASPAARHVANILSDVLNAQGQSAEAVTLCRETLADTPAKEQNDRYTLALESNSACTLAMMGDDPAKAETLLRGVLATQERLHGPLSAQALHTSSLLGHALQGQGKHAEALVAFQSALAAQGRILGPDHPHTLGTAQRLARSLVNQGQPAVGAATGRAGGAAAHKGPRGPH